MARATPAPAPAPATARARAEARGDAGRRSVAARARRARARAPVGAVVDDATTRASGARGVDGARRTRDARDYWFPVCFSGNLRDKDALVAFDLFNVPWVLFRGRDGEVGCVKDECCHRACPLSLGKVVDGRVQCPYHGWEYETNGECAKMPSCSFLKNVFADELRVIERDGMIFVWAGESDPADFVGPEAAYESWDEDVYEANEPGMFTTGEGFVTMAEVIADVKLDSDVVVERLLDITERARREPVSVKNRGRGALFPVDGTRLISKVLRIGYDAVPQSVVFKPSCVIASTIALRPRVGGGDGTSMQVEQLHVCLPAKPGLTRVLFRMAFDFVPEGAQNAAGDVWKNLAMQVLQEELEDVRSAGLKSETTSIAVESFRVFKRGDK